MRAALRAVLGEQGVPRTYDDHLLIIGDAAGHIDPLTGEGIHTAMMARPLCPSSGALARGDQEPSASLRSGAIHRLRLLSLARVPRSAAAAPRSPGHAMQDLRLCPCLQPVQLRLRGEHVGGWLEDAELYKLC